MTFKIRTVVLLATILLLVIPMAACQDAATPAEPADVAEPADAVSEPEEVITLRYASFTAEEMPAEGALVEEYNATNPGVNIALEPCPAFECYDKLVLSHQAGTSPDV